MKRVLITGKGSYIGESFAAYLAKNYPGEYETETLDTLDGHFLDASFSGFDAVFHVAGIAHSDNGKISDDRAKLYYSVNTDLTVKTAVKAKCDGVPQFVFMSSAIVYGDSAPIGKEKNITKDTAPAPTNCYGDSKWQAERGLAGLRGDGFAVTVLRPPMIYGPGCKGNFRTLEKFAAKFPFFPKVKNRRSMLYIENLCEFVRLAIENREDGVFFPQNAEYSETSALVFAIAEAKGKKLRLLRGFTPALRLLSHITPLVNKAFGNLTYDEEMSRYKETYQIVSLAESIRRTEAECESTLSR